MTGRHERSPGPAAYALPTTVGYMEHDKTRWRNPAYLMGIDLKANRDTLGPGPKYYIRDRTRFGTPSPPKFIFNSRRHLKKPYIGPGPGAHSPEKYDHRFRKEIPPSYSMGLQLPSDRDRGTIGPGPAGYNLTRKLPLGPSYSMGLQLKSRMDDSSPGPAAYDVRPKIDRVKSRVPTFKFTGRPPREMTTIGPGPTHKHDYLPGRKAPGYSFGIRHGDYTGSYVLPEDNACINYKEPCN